MNQDQLSREIGAYDQDVDIEFSGGLYGMELADAMMARSGGDTRRLRGLFFKGNLEGLVGGSPKKPTKFNYESFKEEVDRGDLQPNNIFYATDEKKAILREYGIYKLTIRAGESVPIDMAKPERVGRTFQDKYTIAVRRANQ